MLDVELELERLTQSTYPIEQLLQRPLPEGVDPTRLELYLSASHFRVSYSIRVTSVRIRFSFHESSSLRYLQDILNMTKEEFAALPNWKQTNLKKNAGLF